MANVNGQPIAPGMPLPGGAQFYTGPGGMPSGVDTGGGISQLIGLASGAIGSLPEAVLATLKGALDVGTFAQQNQTSGSQALTNAIQQYNYQPNQTPITERLRSQLPESFLPGIQDAISFGAAQPLRDQGYGGAMSTAATLGMLGTPIGAALGAPAKTAQFIDKAYDAASFFPGTKVLQGATGLGSAVGRGAVVGAGASALPAFDNAYNASSNQFNPSTFTQGVGVGAALGGGVSAIANGAQTLKQISQAITARGQQSDAVKVMKDMSARTQQAQAMQQLADQNNAKIRQQVEQQVRAKAPQAQQPVVATPVPVQQAPLQAAPNTLPMRMSQSGSFTTQSGMRSSVPEGTPVAPQPTKQIKAAGFSNPKPKTRRVDADTSRKLTQKTKTLVKGVKETFKKKVEASPLETTGALILPDKNQHSVAVPIQNTISRLSKKLGGQFLKLRQDERLAKVFYNNRLKDLKKSLTKYANDDDIQVLLNNTETKADLAKLPEDLQKSILDAQPVFKEARTKLIAHGIPETPELEIYLPRRVKDLAGFQQGRGKSFEDLIQEQLGNQGRAEFEYPKAERLKALNKGLASKRVIDKYTKADIPHVMKSHEAVDDWINEVSFDLAKGDFFGGNLNKPIGELIAKKVLDSDIKSVKDVQKAYDNTLKYFSSRKYSTSPVYKAYLNTVGLIHLTGLKTSVAQLSSVFSNLERFGPLSTLEGIINTAKSVAGKHTQFTKELGTGGFLQDLTDVGQIKGIGDLTSRISIPKVIKETAYTPLKLADVFGEKEPTYQAAYAWLKKHAGDNNFKVVMNDLKEIFSDKDLKNLTSSLKSLKKNPNQNIITDHLDVLRAVDALAGQRLVVDAGDKAGKSLSKNEFVRALYTFQTYAQKTAADITDRTLNKAIAGVKEKDINKVIDAGRSAAAFATIAVPGFTFLNMISNDKDLKDFVPNAMSTAVRTTMPTTSRIAATVGKTLKAKSGDEALGALAGQTFPGSSRTVQMTKDTINPIIQGTPEAILNPEFNKSFRYYPPQILSEAIYQKSPAAARDRAHLYIAKQNTPEKQKLTQAIEMSKQGFNADQINKYVGTDMGAKELAIRKEELESYKHSGTLDPELNAILKVRKSDYGFEENKLKAAMAQKLADGTLTEEKATALWQNRKQIILQVLKQKIQSGDLK